MSTLTQELFAAIKATTDPDSGETPADGFPTGPNDLALWKEVTAGENTQWDRLTDSKGGVDKWGL